LKVSAGVTWALEVPLSLQKIKIANIVQLDKNTAAPIHHWTGAAAFLDSTNIVNLIKSYSCS
jgi:hypothetical protein